MTTRTNWFAPLTSEETHLRLTGRPKPQRAEPDAEGRRATAEMILEAGRRRRGETETDTMPPEGSLAWKIVMAAKKAKGQS